MNWQPIETASAVGKKRLLFMTAAGKIVTGHRIAKTLLVRPEFAQANRLATHWMPLPDAPA